MSASSVPLPTSDGTFVARFSDRGLAALSFPAPSSAPAPRSDGPAPDPRWVRQTAQALTRVLAGRAPTSLPPLDWSGATEFQQAVWTALRGIPPGATQSYGAIAQAIGRPGAARAVGQACGANPIPVLVPCHRVLAARGRMGGFSGGREWKRRLLAREGVELAEA